MKNYKFTKNWFGATDLEKVLPVNTSEEIHILEIGSFEGKSTVWFIDNILKNQKSTITCIDPWMNFYQNTNSFNSYDENTKTKSGIDYIKDDIKGNFLYNINQTGFSNKVNVIQGLSYLELPKLIGQSKKYDYIYIDGNHTSPFVLTDAVMSWYLLKPNGFIIFDDYKWDNFGGPKTTSPKLAVDSFVSCFGDYIKVIWNDWRYIIKKIYK
jgi:predicted O-methyltransferase YrrM